MSELTHVLSAIERGDAGASAKLLPLVYDALRELAAQRIAQEQPGQSLNATALVHEAYLRLVDGDPQKRWDSRGHFFAAAAEAMRRILVDRARRQRAQKNGGGRPRLALADDIAAPAESDGVDLLALDEALRELEALHPEKVQVVKLRFFAGCSLEDTAELLGISRATAQRTWAYARAWLFGRLNPK
jgi:RNA polymerase sigma factor (TIGR02999 family)